jgi:2,4-dienoyl-CoA reductase-like NADH-dependent reductase (Old Yellow Enzyme family)
VPKLFEPLQLRDVAVRNRLIVSPMCQYSSVDGFADDWHLVHLGSRAVGGAGIVLTEAIAVQDVGRISPHDLGIWKDEHLEMLTRIVRFIEKHGAVAGTQLAHAGRKGSTPPPWERGSAAVPPERGGWTPVAPSALPFSDTYAQPRELTLAEIADVVTAFRDGARRSLEAGFKVIELHAAHGYLIHEFLSPLTNVRTDAYGGSFENRIRLCMESVAAVRSVWPERLPLIVRLSVTDWADGGWAEDDSIELCRRLKAAGVDMIDCSSGGLTPTAPRPLGPLYQVPFARRIRAEVGILTAAVGLITTATEAEQILEEGSADMIAMARQLLRDPYFPLHAMAELGGSGTAWPNQYLRAL